MFYFHGQDGDDKTEDDKFVQLGNRELGNKQAFLMVSPRGMSDGAQTYCEYGDQSAIGWLSIVDRRSTQTRAAKYKHIVIMNILETSLTRCVGAVGVNGWEASLFAGQTSTSSVNIDMKFVEHLILFNF